MITLNAMFNFGKLSKQEKRIIEYLAHNGVFTGTWKEFTETLGEKKTNLSNIRKAVLQLQSCGMVQIERNKWTEFSINLASNWLEKLEEK